ncbi:hypothetical protein C8R47DRAFT_1216655 [Mycena vitilis]|nr:hypothetical protein C8R47DRAFT_1216655 [Mycena vitilis]
MRAHRWCALPPSLGFLNALLRPLLAPPHPAPHAPHPLPAAPVLPIVLHRQSPATYRVFSPSCASFAVAPRPPLPPPRPAPRRARSVPFTIQGSAALTSFTNVAPILGPAPPATTPCATAPCATAPAPRPARPAALHHRGLRPAAGRVTFAL